MKALIASAGFLAILISGSAAFAAERTITLAVENMSCATCPFIVKRTIGSVAGVLKIDVSFQKKTAIVTFDDEKTSIDDVTRASAKAGFPVTPLARDG